MKLTPRHVTAALLLIPTAPVLATLIAGWLISAVVYGIVVTVGHARSLLRSAAVAVRERARFAWWRRWRRPPRADQAVWGW
jgi:hypothetical protein